MENLFMVFKSLSKQKNRNFSTILQLTLVFLMMFLILGSIEKNNQLTDKPLAVIKPNVCFIHGIEKDFMDNLNNVTGYSFYIDTNKPASVSSIDYARDIYNLLTKDKRLKSVGRTYSEVLHEDSLENSNKNSIKADTINLIVICNDDVANQYYNYKIAKGENFSSYNNKSDKGKDIIPILIGPPLEDKNPIGSIVEIPKCVNPNTSKPYKFKVIGILNPFYPTVNEFGQSTALDNNGFVVVIPKLAMYNETYSSVLFQLKNNLDLEKLQKEYKNKFSYCYTYFSDISSTFESRKDENIQLSMSKIFYSVIMLVLSAFGIISISLSALIKRKKEIGIRFAIGAKKTHIIALLIEEYIILFISSGLIALLISTLISKAVSKKDYIMLLVDFNVIAISSAIILVFTVISMLPLILKIFKLNPIEFLKEK